MDHLNSIRDLRFTQDIKGEHIIHSRLPRLREITDEYKINKYLKLSIAADSIKVCKDLFPKENKIFNEVIRVLGLKVKDHELYMSGESHRNAFILSSKQKSQMILSTELSSKLNEDELRFVIGHEFGHFICNHSSIPTHLITSSEDIDLEFKMDVLKWSRCAEITADRYGALCCGKLEASLSALFKVSFGIEPTNISALRKSMKSQYDMLLLLSKNTNNSRDILGKRTHPLIPIRCTALEITFLDIQSFKLQKQWTTSSLKYIDQELTQIINNLI